MWSSGFSFQYWKNNFKERISEKEICVALYPWVPSGVVRGVPEALGLSQNAKQEGKSPCEGPPFSFWRTCGIRNSIDRCCPVLRLVRATQKLLAKDGWVVGDKEPPLHPCSYESAPVLGCVSVSDWGALGEGTGCNWDGEGSSGDNQDILASFLSFPSFLPQPWLLKS